MLKNILNLNGAQQLSNQEQKSIQGGGPSCFGSSGSSYNCYCQTTQGYCYYVDGGLCRDGSQPICP